MKPICVDDEASAKIMHDVFFNITDITVNNFTTIIIALSVIVGNRKIDVIVVKCVNLLCETLYSIGTCPVKGMCWYKYTDQNIDRNFNELIYYQS